MNRRQLDVLGGVVFLVLAVALFAIGIESWRDSDFAQRNVRDHLVPEKIFFPPANKLTPAERRQPDVRKFAGQRVDNGKKAHVYADQFIALHLKMIAGGKTYAEVSEQARANPGDQQLASQAERLFRGETLRGLLLTTYAFWTIGEKAHTVAIWMFIGAGVLFVLGLGGLWHASRTPAPSQGRRPPPMDETKNTEVPVATPS
jgi:hypothetical protein